LEGKKKRAASAENEVHCPCGEAFASKPEAQKDFFGRTPVQVGGDHGILGSTYARERASSGRDGAAFGILDYT